MEMDQHFLKFLLLALVLGFLSSSEILASNLNNSSESVGANLVKVVEGNEVAQKGQSRFDNKFFSIAVEEPIEKYESKNAQADEAEDKLVIQAPFGFRWGDSLDIVQSKICSIAGVETVEYGSSRDEFSRDDFCKKHLNYYVPSTVDIDDFPYVHDLIDTHSSEEVPGLENKRFAGYFRSIVFWPVMLKGVRHIVALNFGGNEDVILYDYLENKNHASNSIAIHCSDKSIEFITNGVLSEVRIEAENFNMGSSVGSEISDALEKKYKERTTPAPRKKRELHPDRSKRFVRWGDTITAKLNDTTLNYFENGSRLTYEGGYYLKLKHKGYYKNYLKSLTAGKADDSSSL
jgi:hypothetical protein